MIPLKEFLSIYDEVISEGYIDPQHHKQKQAIAELIKRTGLCRRSVYKMLELAKKKGLYPRQQPVENNIDTSKLKSRIKALEKENHELSSKYNSLAHALFEVDEATKERVGTLEVQTTKSNQVSNIPVTVWSDWHIGEVVVPAEIHNINKFNLEVAQSRVNKLVSRTLDLCFEHSAHKEYPDGIVIFLLGDMVSGSIHEELEKTNEVPVLHAVIETVNMLVAAITTLSNYFPKITISCVAGNHGRLTDRMQAKNFHLENLDWLIYNFVRDRLKDIPSITIDIPESSSAFVKVANMTFLGMHGCELGTGGGEAIIGPVGKIIRGEQKVRSSLGQVGLGYDILLLGHYHQTLWLPRVFVNNCIKGYDEYAYRVLKAMPSTPSQILFFVNEKYGVVSKHEVFL